MRKYVFRRHNEELASAIVRLGALEHIVSCLEDFDTQVYRYYTLIIQMLLSNVNELGIH